MNNLEFEEKIQKMFNETMILLNNIGIKPSHNINKVSVNRRAKKRLGCCKAKKVNGVIIYDIEISAMLINSSDKEIMEVIIHELLHSVKGCMNHGKKWKYLAGYVEEKTGYKISSTANFDDLNIEKIDEKIRYIITCENCKTKYYRKRRCDLVKKTCNYRCGKCGGKLKVNDFGNNGEV